MTRHERISLGVSITALVISIMSPLLSYYWFQNEVRLRQLKIEAFHVDGSINYCKGHLTYEVRLRNTGVWPIEKVRLELNKVVHSLPYLTPTINRWDIGTEPPLQISTEEKKHFIVVRFQDALPPKSDVALAYLRFDHARPDLIDSLPDMETMLPTVWVTSEVSSFYVDWNIMTTDCSTVVLQR
jgi:hypothetical protein